MRKIFLIITILITIFILSGCKNEENKKQNAEQNLAKNRNISQLIEYSYEYSELVYNSSDLLGLVDDIAMTKINEIDNIDYVPVTTSKYVKLDEIYELTKKTFLNESLDHYNRFLNDNNTYIQLGDELNVKKDKNYCDIGINYDFNAFEIISETDSTITIKFNGKEHIIYIEDGKYKLKYNIFDCLDQN